MNTQNTVDQLAKLKLPGMARTYRAMLSTPIQDQPSIHQLIAQMADAEVQERNNKKTEVFLKLSKLRYSAMIEQVHCSAHRNFTKENLLALAGCGFITVPQNILITGATGCGKSYLACALGRQACTLNYKTVYFSMARLIESVTQSKLDGTYPKFMNRLGKARLIILDDFGLHPLNAEVRLALFQLFEDAYGRSSFIITSQLPVANWHHYIGDPTLADAILDRLTGNASRIELKGESLRKKI
jgi:DNA replication protein DnaC